MMAKIDSTACDFADYLNTAEAIAGLSGRLRR